MEGLFDIPENLRKEDPTIDTILRRIPVAARVWPTEIVSCRKREKRFGILHQATASPSGIYDIYPLNLTSDESMRYIAKEGLSFSDAGEHGVNFTYEGRKFHLRYALKTRDELQKRVEHLEEQISEER